MKEVKISFQQSLEYLSSSEHEGNIIISDSVFERPVNKKISWYFSLFSLLLSSLLTLISWLSIIWLYKYHFIFTIHRYISSPLIKYFPIQVPSIFLFFLIFFTVIIITTTYFYSLSKVFIYKTKDTKLLFYQAIFNSSTKYHIIPIFLNIILLCLSYFCQGKILFFHVIYFLGLGLVIISIYFLVDLYFVIDFGEDILSKIIIKYFFLGSLIEIDLYYFFYVVCQIIYYYTVEEGINAGRFIGISANVFMGTVCFFVSYEMENFILPFFFSIIYNGIILFHYSVPKNTINEIDLGKYEVIGSMIYIILFVIEMFFLFISKLKYNFF